VNPSAYLFQTFCYFVLSFYGTDKNSTANDVTAKTLFFHQELSQTRKIKILCSGSDGED
jgi:hypothetical protein